MNQIFSKTCCFKNIPVAVYSILHDINVINMIFNNTKHNIYFHQYHHCRH